MKNIIAGIIGAMIGFGAEAYLVNGYAGRMWIAGSFDALQRRL
jgi:hypothetical protein